MNDTEIMLRAEIRVLERVIADRGYQKPPVMPSQRTPEFLALRRKICGGSCFTEIDMLNDGGVTEASVICGPCDIKTMEQLNPDRHLEIVEASLNRFNRCASGLVSKDYAEGYREACQHIIDRFKE